MHKRASLGVILFAAVAGYSSVAVADGIAVAPLPDGRLQLFFVSQGRLLTSWKQTPDPNSVWTPLAGFAPAPRGAVSDVAVGRLPDGRLQLFSTSPNGQLSTSWKQSIDPNSLWTDWVPF
jgi:hypothetical protein